MKDVEPRSFPHYKRIAKEFDKAKKRAWASIKMITTSKITYRRKRSKLKTDKQTKAR